MAGRSRLIALSLALGWVLFGPSAGAARAHSRLIKAQPEPDSVHSRSFERALLVFSEPIELRFSTFFLQDETGRKRNLPVAADTLKVPVTLQITLPPMSPGSYRILWSVLSVDGHRQSGSLPFAIRHHG